MKDHQKIDKIVESAKVRAGMITGEAKDTNDLVRELATEGVNFRYEEQVYNPKDGTLIGNFLSVWQGTPFRGVVISREFITCGPEKNFAPKLLAWARGEVSNF